MNERTLLAAHDQREKKLRHTKAAMKAAAASDLGIGVLDIIDLQPEHEVLYLKLSAQRKELLGHLGSRAVRSVRLAVCFFLRKGTHYMASGLIRATLQLHSNH
jgi:E3 ubiquitin-protein ligase SHPRH